MNTIDKYKQLVERYFEATTTEEQEERLWVFLTTPQADEAYFNEIKAVLGLTTILRCRNQQISSSALSSSSEEEQSNRASTMILHPWKPMLRWAAVAILGFSIVTAAMVGWKATNSDECIAYINGKEVTNPQEVLQQMQKTMTETLQDDSEEQSVLLLRDFFATPQQ